VATAADQFDRAPSTEARLALTVNRPHQHHQAFSVSGKRFGSRNREMLGEMRDRGREASPVRLSI
jgi:hypothetical protein